MRDLFLISLAIWGTEAAFYGAVGLALDIRVNPITYIFLVATANIGAGIPLTQAGVGFIFLAQRAFVAVGESTELATAYALSLQALIAAPIVVLGPLAIFKMHLGWHDLLPIGKRAQAAPERTEHQAVASQAGPSRAHRSEELTAHHP